MRHTTALAWVAVALTAAGLLMSGCSEPQPVESAAASQNRAACGSEGCHPDQLTAQAEGVHADVGCAACHEGTGKEHAADPKNSVATTDWTIDSCASCHEGEAATYLYEDGVQVGPYGGSVTNPAQPKTDTFPNYNKIVAGHGFTKEYNEEGGHGTMLEAHIEIKRGKFETCVQCKSTKLAYVWDSGKSLKVASDTQVELAHTAAPGKAAAKVKIPKGTTITYATDAKAQVDAKATFPDGTVWTSRPKASEDATKSYNMLWASTIAAIKETEPYGAGCNHCHDPHSARPRIVRKALATAIKERGVNPYAAKPEKDYDLASARDKETLSCAQCHVEYVCGKSGVDKIDRDYFGWAKATDLDALYTEKFEYGQDWRHATIGEPLIKSQHPETELYWNSPHYDAGASCADCHMPEVVGADGDAFRSHWFTSPYKYRDGKTWNRFASTVGLSTAGNSNSCTYCHADRTDRAIGMQKTFFAEQQKVEKMLAESVDLLTRIEEQRKSGRKVPEGKYDNALAAHRKAHVVWENLAVSENSMGFHNFDEAMSSMKQAAADARTAIAASKEVLGEK